MKRNIIILIIALAALTSGYLILSKEGVVFSSKETSIYKAVPIDAPLFIEVNSLKSIPLRDNIFLGLENAGIMKPLFSTISRIDSLIAGSKDIPGSIRDETVLVVLTLEGKGNIVPLFILKAQSNSKKNGLKALVAKLFPATKYIYTKRPYNGRKIIGATLKSSNKSFHYSFANGLFIASPKSILVEQAIRQLDSESILNDTNFALVNRTATQQSKASVYINHKHFPPLIQDWFNPGARVVTDEFGKKTKTSYTAEVKKFSNYAAWSELDLTVHDNDLKLNGITTANDSMNHYLSVFAGQQPVRYQIDKVLPKKTAMFLNFAISDKGKFFKNLDDFYTHSESFYSREVILKKINARSRTDVKQLFQDILEDEVAMAFVNIPSDPSKKNTIFVVATKGQRQAKEEVTKLLKKYSAKNNLPFKNLVSNYEVDKETNYTIYKFPFPSFPGVWLSGPFKAVSANYFAFWDNYIIFSSSKARLEEQLHGLVLEATLAKDIDYLRYKQNLDSKVNINFYLDINLGFPLNKAYFSGTVAKRIASKKEALEKFGALSWQVVNTNGFYFNSLYINYPEEVKADAKTTWQSNIGSQAATKPQLTINHNDLRNKEIIVQDKRNRLHQITKEGRIRWVIKLPERIMSEIHQVDFLKNGKYQYFFNTKDKFYLIDRNGNNVAPFPINLRAEATNGVSVFDYDGNRNYRYLIAGKDKKIYCYDSAGKIVDGWKFKHTDHLVTLPVQHFRTGGKDYIVFKDKSRIYIQNRRGETRVKIPVNFENSDNPLIFSELKTPKIIATDTKGSVYYLYFNGKYEKKKTPGFSKNHFFTASDLDGNGVIDFVFIDKNNMTVIAENGKKLFSKEFKLPIVNHPNIYTFSSKLKKIGIVSHSGNRIYLFNPDGSLHPGFPLLGNSEFSIGKITAGTGYFNLIVGSKDGNIYNYKLK